jgi:hypothetical protein
MGITICVKFRYDGSSNHESAADKGMAQLNNIHMA